jgi:hypothetical protein
MTRLYVTCPKCSHRNERAGGRTKCQGCASTLPKRRVPKHAETLRDTSYQRFAELNYQIHFGRTGIAVSDGPAKWEDCGVCGRASTATRRHDRDHDHRTGLARGLACVRCNRELLRNTTLEEARLVVAYLERVENFYGGSDA